MRESSNQNRARLHFANMGYKLFRNNVGVLKDERGRPVRYGLANDSSALNKNIKSGDLIGWRPVMITPDMVGTVVAQFVSVEIKDSDWKFPSRGKGFEHASAQFKWAEMIRRDGGLAGFMKEIEGGIFSR